jgi:predicted anti-sigma-YlaC factor YlaD
MEPTSAPGRLLIWMTMPWPAEAQNRPPKGNLKNLRALLSCEAVSDELPLVVDGCRRPSDAMSEHLRTCLVCQAELAGYRRLLRLLRSMRGDADFVPSPELVGSTLSALRRHPSWAPRRSEPWRVAALTAVGVVALGAGALWARAGRHSRFIASAV